MLDKIVKKEEDDDRHFRQLESTVNKSDVTPL